jgi:hypothetical protein
MKTKLASEPELMSRSKPGPGHWSWPLRSIGRLMTLVALSGLALAVWTEGSRRPNVPPAIRIPLRRAPRAQALDLPRTRLPAERDRSVIVAPGGIDEAMIKRAPEGIDDAMIFNPLEPRRAPVMPSPIPGPEVPR